jgi:hypothetical protein
VLNGGIYGSGDETSFESRVCLIHETAPEPTAAITLTVVNGLFNVLLGETNPITYGMFLDSDRWLRVWFDDGTHGVQLLEPDTQMTTAPFAFQSDYALTAINATTATFATTAGDAATALTATNATTATFATTAGDAATALTATNATTATYATTSLTATNATTATTAVTSSQASGIAFPSTQVPSAGANTLDDYEEGTVNVTLVALTSGTITLDINTLAYTKIGRVVYVTGYLHVSAVSSPVGHLQIQGLPFVCADGDQFSSAVNIKATTLAATATTSIMGQVNKNATTLTILKYAAGATSAMAADVQTNSTFMIQAIYFTQ